MSERQIYVCFKNYPELYDKLMTHSKELLINPQTLLRKLIHDMEYPPKI